MVKFLNKDTHTRWRKKASAKGYRGQERSSGQGVFERWSSDSAFLYGVAERVGCCCWFWGGAKGGEMRWGMWKVRFQKVLKLVPPAVKKKRVLVRQTRRKRGGGNMG